MYYHSLNYPVNLPLWIPIRMSAQNVKSSPGCPHKHPEEQLKQDKASRLNS